MPGKDVGNPEEGRPIGGIGGSGSWCVLPREGSSDGLFESDCSCVFMELFGRLVTIPSGVLHGSPDNFYYVCEVVLLSGWTLDR